MKCSTQEVEKRPTRQTKKIIKGNNTGSCRHQSNGE